LHGSDPLELNVKRLLNRFEGRIDTVKSTHCRVHGDCAVAVRLGTWSVFLWHDDDFSVELIQRSVVHRTEPCGVVTLVNA
jgi:hypothetical protein